MEFTVKEEKAVTTTFKNIGCGELFMFGRTIFMKAIVYDETIAVRLANGITYSFKDEEKVIPMVAKNVEIERW